ncbi:murein L,D-transpeptidase YafK [Chitinivorax tropicus]|uniref:Murein L,D-transpeptidase YafK n=1 Tax=Chitinivorax tropicus TaxID=714531 RepID=A0A840MTB7_9PROT|nr:L,D-transpeptidase family protein [Chitinivorax tropicus]MBB5019513.1 murein L,D-transpeptidase YafK [Chitinivorax tropicus]
MKSRDRRPSFKVATRLIVVMVGLLYVVPPTANSMSSGIVRLPKAIKQDWLAALPGKPEALLVATLQRIQDGHLQDALRIIDRLLSIEPNYKLAHLIKGDLLLARSRPLDTMGDAQGASAEAVNDLRHEALVRLSRYQAPPPADAIPADLLQLAPDQPHAVVVDTTRSRLFVYKNDHGVPRYVADYYITIGKKGFEKAKEGDQRTPIGVYQVTSRLERAKLDQLYGKQAELYGIGAWPLNYPNEWDRRQKRGGSGIWLHGTPYDTYSRAPLASNGCVVLTNQDMGEVGQWLQIGGTPVVISNGVKWVSRQEWQAQRALLGKQLERWRQDWESLDTQRYLTHYSAGFAADGVDLAKWSKQKQQIHESKTWAKIQLSNVSILRYPAAMPMALITFDQYYQSNNLAHQMKKRQFWAFEDGRWQIVYEGTG